MVLSWVGESALYLCYAVLAGWSVFLRTMPGIEISRKVIFASLFGIALCGFFPVWRIVMFFSADYGFGLTLQHVLLRLAEGRAYLLTLFLLAVFCLTLRFAKPETDLKAWFVCVLLLCAMMVVQAFTGHAASFHGVAGLVPHACHFIAVSVWAGGLLMAGWHVPVERWKSFLGWFHPTAILAMVVIVASGCLLMAHTVRGYLSAWVLPYGQALLFKHLLLVPLMVFAVFNGWWMKKKLAGDKHFDPRPWVKAEAVFLLLIFSATGLMSQQPAPHDISATSGEYAPSSLIAWLHGHLPYQASVLFLGLAFLCLIVAAVGVFIKLRPMSAVAAGLLFAVFAFVAAVTFVSSGWQ